MSNDMLSTVIEKVVDSKIEKAMRRGRPKTEMGEYIGRDSEGRQWVRLNGSDISTPVKRSYAEVATGDTVSVTIQNGYAVINNNVSNPSAGLKGATETKKTAIEARNEAKLAIDYASQAQTAANAATENSEIAQKQASNATAAANLANRSAESAQNDAAVAKNAADNAVASAEVAYDAAKSAQEDAEIANTSANKALSGLAIVEDVAGTLDWITEHGHFELSSDTSVDIEKIYFVYDDTLHDYTPIVNPDSEADPSESGWYELDISDSQTKYIMSHLAVTSRGLWILPSGITEDEVVPTAEDEIDGDDQASAVANARARLGENYKVLLSEAGMYIYDGNGDLVAVYGPNGIDYAAGKPYHIGSDDAYILYTPPSNGNPGRITIGGSNIQLGSDKTLSELLAEVEGTLILDTTTAYDSQNQTVTIEAHLYRGGVDVRSEFNANDFRWGIKRETDVVPIPLDPGYGYSCTVDWSEAGYGATVVCTFEPSNNAQTDEVNIYNPNAIGQAVQGAKEAYVTEVSGDGIWVTPSDAKPVNGQAAERTRGWHIANALEYFRGTVRYIKAWLNGTVPTVRLGQDNSGHADVTPSGLEVFTDASTSVAEFGADGSRIGSEVGGNYIYINSSKLAMYSNNASALSVLSSDAAGSVAITKNVDRLHVSSSAVTETFDFLDDAQNGSYCRMLFQIADDDTFNFTVTKGSASQGSVGISPSTVTYSYDGAKSITLTPSRAMLFGINTVIYIASDYAPTMTFGTRDDSKTKGTHSSSFGVNLVASGNSSHAEGEDSQAIGGYSHAEGHIATASGSSSHAEGYQTIASAQAAHAEGHSTIASMQAAHAEGAESSASGYYSHSQNRGTEAAGYCQTAIGKYNEVDGAADGAYGGDYAFIVGNGTSDSDRSNAFAVDWDGIPYFRNESSTWGSIFDLVYPVGSIYTSVNSTNPETLFGGTWERITGRFLLAATDDGSSGAFQAAGNTGGEASHALTPGETATKNHSHTMNHGHENTISYSMDEKGGHAHKIKYNLTGGSGTARAIITPSGNTTQGSDGTNTAGAHKHTLTKSGGVTDYSGSTGGQTAANGSAHNNMPPFLAVYVWERTA